MMETVLLRESLVQRTFLTTALKTAIALSAFALSSLWVFPGRSDAQTVILPGTSPHTISVEALLQDLTQVNVVYLGETHSRPEDHRSQLEILTALRDRHPNLAIGMEMFQRPYQEYLNAYLAGSLSETELRSQTEYDQRWGYDWEYYAPILRFAQTHGIPVLALNVPTEITRRVAQEGLAGLTPADKQWIPDASELDLSSDRYRQRIVEIFSQHAHGNSNSAETFFLAQVLWDETMAEVIANYVRDRPDVLMVVLVGQGHVAYGDGIPNRVQRRLNEQPWVDGALLLQRSLIFTLPSEDILPQDIADYLWEAEPEILPMAEPSANNE